MGEGEGDFSIGGFFSDIVSSVVKAPAKIVKALPKVATAVATGGVSLIAPKLTAPVEQAVSKLYDPNIALSVLTKNPAPLLGGSTMAGLDLSSLLGGANASSALRQVTSAITPSLGGAVNALTTLGGLFQQTRPITPGTVVPPAQAAMMLPSVGRAVVSVGAKFAQKFPNLAAGLNNLRARGANVNRSKLWGLLKRFGPDILISGGILTAAAVSELMVAGPGRRRMNPANAKALRRSMRRLKSFDRLCVQTNKLLHRSPSRSRRSSVRCTTCRSSPCRC